MKLLQVNRIIEIIETCSEFAPGDSIRNAANAVIQEVTDNPPSVTSTDDSVLFLRRTVDHFRQIIEKPCFDRLESTDLFVVPKPICNAYADHEENSIVIFEGLLEVLVFRMEVSLLIARAQKHFERVSAATGISAQEFSATAFQATSLSLRFMFTNRPPSLPKLEMHFDESLKYDAHMAFFGGVLFILFHELGHLVLGHGAAYGGAQSKNPPTLACFESINLQKEQEFEADAFAFEAIRPEWRGAIIVNVWYVMNLFLDYETFQSGWRQAHPLTINRIERLNTISGALDDPVIGAKAVQMFEQRLKMMKSRSEWFHPEEPNLPRSVWEKLRTDALLEALGSESDGLMAVEKLLEFYRLVS